MTNSLVKIVRDTESSLATLPPKYSTQLELFTREEEEVLAEFLRQERDEKPHYLRNKDWETLVGEPEAYSRPGKYLKEERKEFPELEKKLKDFLAEGKLLELGVSPETVAVFGDFPTMAYRMLDMKTRLSELVVAYAKQIGDEKGVNPIHVVRSSESRDEIYRRIFQTREQFEWYNNTSVQMGITALGAVYKFIELLEPEIREIEKIPIVGWLAKRKLKKALKKFPPKAVAESFLRDDIAYDARRAVRIYGDNLRDTQIIEAEIVR
ncbi:hypothetical protein HYX19_05300 [Candidatus Woesearchaeota archaeon]|nr:hypothetical protein [Candidatus Woesearchaeota archaeon]